MRIIEPHKNKKSRSNKTALVAILFSILLVAGGGVIVAKLYNSNKRLSSAVLAVSNNIGTSVDGESYKYFSDDDFQKLYGSIAYPNTQVLTVSPKVTSNAEADKRIQEIADSRGSSLQAIPVAPIIKFNEMLLQQKAYAGWQLLDSTAKQDNIPLTINLAYVSIDQQRQEFLKSVYSQHVSNAQIATGVVDNAILQAMKLSDIPGYSILQTGYAVRIQCGAGTQDFLTTTCYKWLSNDNYLNAKKNGWIPVKTDNINSSNYATFVWVGEDAVKS